MRKLFPILALAAAIPACTFDAGGADADVANPLRANLARRAFLDLGNDSRVGVTATDPSGQPLPDVQPTVTGGRAVLRATDDGFVIVEDLDVKLADVTVQCEPGAKPIHLTDLALRLGTQVDADGDWSPDGMTVAGEGSGDLLLDWSWLLDDGTIYPLATQKLSHAPFSLQIGQDDHGQLTAAVWMKQDGDLRTIADQVTLSDLSMAVVAVRPGLSTR